MEDTAIKKTQFEIWPRTPWFV